MPSYPRRGGWRRSRRRRRGRGGLLLTTHCTGACYDVAARSTGRPKTRGGGSRRWAGREDRATSFRDRPDVQRGGGGRRRGGRRRRRRRRATRPKGCSPAEGPRAEAAALRPAARSGAMPPFKRTTYKGSTTATAVSRTNPCLGTGLSRGRATDAPKICFKNAGAPFEVPGAAIWGGVGRKRIQGALRKPFLRPGALVRTLRAGLARLVARARAPPTPLNCGASPRPTPRTPTPRPLAEEERAALRRIAARAIPGHRTQLKLGCPMQRATSTARCRPPRREAAPRPPRRRAAARSL